VPDTPKRQWSLGAAREILSDVRDLTEQATAAVEALLTEVTDKAPESPERQAADLEVQHIIASWASAMEALGLEVKGPWLVDFDCGSGLYCWRWPEEKLEYFHGYDEGFADRIRIQ
jgi:hypothetical protein